MQNGPTLGIFKPAQCLVWFKDILGNTIQVTERHNVRNALIIVQYKKSPITKIVKNCEKKLICTQAIHKTDMYLGDYYRRNKLTKMTPLVGGWMYWSDR